MTDLPHGTVTFVFTDVEGSTRLLRALGRDRYAQVLGEHERILRDAFEGAGGQEIDNQGDAFFAAFSGAGEAVKAAETAQRALDDFAWPDGAKVRVRMGIHTGEPVLGEKRYVGIGVHKAARICAAGHGGQVLLSRITHDLLDDDEVPGVTFRDLGEQKLKDIDAPERLYQLEIEGLPSSFPALKVADTTPFEGNVSSLAEAAAAARPGIRRTRRRELLGAALIGVLAAAVAIPVFALGSGSPEPSTPAKPAAVVADSVAMIDLQTGKVAGDVRVGHIPGSVVFGDDAVWVGNFDDKTISRVDPRTRDVRTLGVGVRPYGQIGRASCRERV